MRSSGDIPPGLCVLSSLKVLYLNNNGFTGESLCIINVNMWACCGRVVRALAARFRKRHVCRERHVEGVYAVVTLVFLLLSEYHLPGFNPCLF